MGQLSTLFPSRYGAYVGFMKFNESVEDGLRRVFKLPPVVSAKGVKLDLGPCEEDGAMRGRQIPFYLPFLPFTFKDRPYVFRWAREGQTLSLRLNGEM